MMRGNYRQKIFIDDVEREYFCSLLQKMVENYGCKIHLFCLMSNHVHLVIEVKNVPLWKIMQALSSNFSNYCNKKNDRVGHLLQGRYKAKLVQDEKYLLELCYYIHFNPISAKMVSEIDAYPWSTHASYMRKNAISWVTTEYIESILSKIVQATNNKNYEQFIKEESMYLDKVTFCEFTDGGELIIKDSVNDRVRNQLPKDLTSLSIHQISLIVCQHLAIEPEHLPTASCNRRVILARSIIAYFAHYCAHHYIIRISEFFDRKPESVSRAMHRELKTRLQEPVMKLLMTDIENDLNKLITLQENIF